MLELESKQILVSGRGGRGQAACGRSGAKMVVVDHANSHALWRGADRLRSLGGAAPPAREFSRAIPSPAGPINAPLVEAVRRSKGSLSSELDLGFEPSQCRKRILATGNLFTPCTVADSLLETEAEAAKNATSSDVVLPAPACSSWDQFRNHQQRGEVFCQAVKSIGRDVRGGTPNLNGKTEAARQ